jgi:hypothetical protein
MAEILAVLWQVIKNWWAFMSCAFWTFAGLWQLSSNPTSWTQIKVFFILAGLSLVLGFLQTIFTEHRKRIAAEKKLEAERPRLGVNTHSVEGPKAWAESPVPVTFTIQHINGRVPTSIHFEPVTSKHRKFALAFNPLPYANRPPHPTLMGFEIIEVGVPSLNAVDWEKTRPIQKQLLGLFLDDSPIELVKLEYPLVGHFIDGDDPCSQTFCLRFEKNRFRFLEDTSPPSIVSS